jgi:hypothetical protein
MVALRDDAGNPEGERKVEGYEEGHNGDDDDDDGLAAARWSERSTARPSEA